MNSHFNKNNKSANIEQNRVSLQRATYYEGQIPPPEMMEHYGNIDPDFPKTILRMASDESKHRHYCEKMTTRTMSASTIMGLIFAFLSVLIICYLVYFALSNDQSTAAGVISTGAIAAVVSAFLLRKPRSPQK